MTKYDIMFESLQEKVNSGELTVEEAEVLNNVAFEKYGDDETEYETVTESSEDEGVTYEEYLEAMEEELFGEATRLAKEIHKKGERAYKKSENELFQAGKYGLRAVMEDDPEKIKRYKKLSIKNLKAGEKHLLDYEDYDKFDSIGNQNTDEGRLAKFAQKIKYDLEPSKRSLENKEPGGYF